MHQPGIEPGPHAWEARILTIGPLVLTRLKRVEREKIIIDMSEMMICVDYI